jgi:hypothetical protein
MGHYQEYHSDGHTDWLTTSLVAEPKPSPSTQAQDFERISITPPDSCSDCGYRGTLLPEMHKCRCCGYVKVPRPDSSSIPNEHKNGWHYGYITCSCGWAWDSRKALTGELDTEIGLKMFEKHRDSSSISTEQTFDEWWNSQDQYELARSLEGQDDCDECCKSYAAAAWNAAKGQSNGR